MCEWVVSSKSIIHYCDCPYKGNIEIAYTNLWDGLKRGYRLCKHCLKHFYHASDETLYDRYCDQVNDVYWEYDDFYFRTSNSIWHLDLRTNQLWHTHDMRYPLPFAFGYHFQKDCVSIEDALSYGIEHDYYHPFLKHKPKEKASIIVAFETIRRNKVRESNHNFLNNMKGVI